MPRPRSGRGLSSLSNFIVPAACAGAACYVFPIGARADQIGLTQLHAIQPGLNGSGIRVAQVEAPETNGSSPPDFEVDPNGTGVNQPASLFTYYSTNGISNTFGDSVGSNSYHARDVAAGFYGTAIGVATNVSHVDNYEADYFNTTVIAGARSMAAQVVNSSYAIGDSQGNAIQDPSTDQEFDNYVANNPGRIFVAAAGNGGPPISPSTMYNGISVGAFGATSTATGPTQIGGRSKPDIVAPAGETSFASPDVAGAAAILLQAGAAGDGGVGTISNSQDFRTVKALLLNGAVKPAGWSHTAQMPLDPSNGAGVLNIYNSYELLAAGRQTPTASTITTSTGGNYTPATNIASFKPSSGWDFNTLTNTASTDTINHYYFNLTSASTATATLDWELQSNKTTLNNLDLLLYNVASGTMVAQSDSMVDNVEQVYLASLAAGEYDLEVVKRGNSGSNTGFLDTSESYGLAYSFAQTPEPTSLMGLAGGAMFMMARRRRWRPVV
jgi:hypothetical protein